MIFMIWTISLLFNLFKYHITKNVTIVDYFCLIISSYCVHTYYFTCTYYWLAKNKIKCPHKHFVIIFLKTWVLLLIYSLKLNQSILTYLFVHGSGAHIWEIIGSNPVFRNFISQPHGMVISCVVQPHNHHMLQWWPGVWVIPLFSGGQMSGGNTAGQ